MKIIITESQLKNIVESHDKAKTFLKDNFGFDFSGRIKQITSIYDVPMSFDECLSSSSVNRYLNYWGPMYLFELGSDTLLYQDRGDFEWFLVDSCWEYVDDEILEDIGIYEMGLRFSDIVDMYFEEEE